jgi:Arc/MetJ-type ribon-helix-helix transcriptional regulator
MPHPTTERRTAAGIRRITLDMPPLAMARLERLRDSLEAASFAEVVRAALRAYEDQLAGVDAPAAARRG